MSKSEENKLLIVDGHAMVFRAWFSIPERLNSNQTDTRGAYGFINTLLKTIREHSISHVSVCFDTKAPTFRDKIFPEYKAQRPPVDPNLHKQIPIRMCLCILGLVKSKHMITKLLKKGMMD